MIYWMGVRILIPIFLLIININNLYIYIMAKFNLSINIDDKILDNANLSVVELINDIGEIINDYCAENELFMRIDAEILDEHNVDNISNNDSDFDWIEGYRVPKIPS